MICSCLFDEGQNGRLHKSPKYLVTSALATECSCLTIHMPPLVVVSTGRRGLVLMRGKDGGGGAKLPAQPKRFTSASLFFSSLFFTSLMFCSLC